MNAPLRLALIGAGGIAQSYGQALQNHPDARLAAVCDPRPGAAESLAAAHGAEVFDSAEDLWRAAARFDAAIICTPPDTHEALTLAALARGLAVLCEKPFTLTSASARRMARAAEAAGRVLTMASKFRYVEDVRAAKALLDSGELGEVILVENAFTSHVTMRGRWNADRAVSGGGVLIDNGTHSVDLIRYFLGPLAEVHAVEGKRIQHLEVEDTARLFVRSTAGVMGSVDLSWSLNKELDWYLNVYASGGTVQVGWKQSRYRRAGAAEWVAFGRGYQKVEAFSAQIANFARAIRGEEALRITCDDAIASVDVIAAAYRSMAGAPWTETAARLTQTPPPAARPLTVSEARDA